MIKVIQKNSVKDSRVREYVSPVKILWTSNNKKSVVENPQALLENCDGQVTLSADNACVLRNRGEEASILLDYGVEIYGGVQIAVWECGIVPRSAKIRVRFGESAMEAMSEVGSNNTATNDHAMRDQVIEVSRLGSTEIGNTGFRFVRIDLLDEGNYIELKSVRAVFLHRDLKYIGSFHSSDPVLNQVWETGAYTVHLNMQDYLWDGIKRDRLVWIGDMHPETSTIQAVFGNHDIVKESLDFVRDCSPLPIWMNTFPSYSIWWIIIHHDWYMQYGDLEYLREQREYLIGLLKQLADYIDEKGNVTAPNPFLDWPSSSNKEGVLAGIHALFTLAMMNGAKLCTVLEEKETIQQCNKAEKRLRSNIPNHANSKQAAALLALAGLMSAEEASSSVISVDGVKDFSTFYGYYMLMAQAEAGDIQSGLDSIREYWGGMLRLGATTFWEDFDISWLKNAASIDELTPEGKVDVHGQYGDYCYVGYRHSFCHGWASGPTAWLSRYVLGIEILESGCRKVRISPHLGDLEWVEGTFPTPFGPISVKHMKQTDGSIATEVHVPDEIAVC
ncbi:alpha-L-rhamnosidase-related protein [Bacillus solitudinis]|uniref:alpha-L-rhamnosidase-related protein n=1 Tax=Bacillus solitudinis TaxID=2014074 RepID=UPI000C24F219|nr:alpha-L-rhamnosidase C-terminal domain-containing protein [Bacillus solitudinis]